MSEIMITVRHIRLAGLCMKGAREWADGYGLSWSDFIDGPGIPISVLENLHDGLANLVCEAARKEIE